MTQAQLLAIDTILPTVLGVAGVIFLAAALWPLRAMSRGFAGRSALLGRVGAGCVAVGVWLWLSVLGTAGRVVDQAASSAVSASARASASPAASPSPAASASPLASASAAPAASAAPVAGSAAVKPSSAPPASASGGPTAVPPTPTIPTNLTPVAPVAFQPDNAPAHAVVVGVEPFEHGSMLYRDDLKQIYVLTLDQKFKAYPDTWKEGTNPDLGYAPQGASKITPARGFGWLWASDPDVRQTLGAAIATEQGFTGSISGDGTTTIVRADVTYAFNKDGSWALK